MRVVEEKISDLVREGLKGKEFVRTLSKRDKVVSDGKGEVKVILWNTTIATFDANKNKVKLNSGGYHTTTTKSRLNALIQDWVKDNPYISQKNFQWYTAQQCPLTFDIRYQDFEDNTVYELKYY